MRLGIHHSHNGDYGIEYALSGTCKLNVRAEALSAIIPVTEIINDARYLFF